MNFAKANDFHSSIGQAKLQTAIRFEAEHLLARSGFEVEHLYAGYDKSEYGSKYPGELIFVARKG